MTPMENKLKRVKARLKRDREKKKVFNGSIKLSNKFELDNDLVVMRKPYTQEFFDAFNSGFNDYIEGKWESARAKLEKIESIREGPDGPTLSLLRVMHEHNFKAPADWEGWRELD